MKNQPVLIKKRLQEQLSSYPPRLFEMIMEVADQRNVPIYLSGGALRDWLMGMVPNDLDFTISHGALEFLEEFRGRYKGGTIVPLGMRYDDTCRLVLSDAVLDVSGFRKGSGSIEEDLSKRDFTVNAMGIELRSILEQTGDVVLVDPMNGLADMATRQLRACPGAFSDDPLRMLRAFRFSALLDFTIVPETLRAIAARANLIDLSAVERIRYELDQLVMSPRAYRGIEQMKTAGLLEWVFPELYEGDGVDQPSFHHLDVMQHNMMTLGCMEKVINQPEQFFPQDVETITEYLSDSTTNMLLKWASLFHDVGKPVTREVLSEKDDRITFYGHDEEGARKFVVFAERLKWGRNNRQRVSRLISMHMHPFHLCNVLREKGQVSHRAQLKICRKAGEELAGLFLLAMADSLAGQGEDKPAGMEEELAALFSSLNEIYHETVLPVLKGPKLLTGNDLIATLGLVPGPQFQVILGALDLAIIEGSVSNREEALNWVREYIKESSLDEDE